MRLSYLDILEQCFHDKFRGYNKQEVDTFLHLVADDFKSMSEEIKEKERVIATKDNELKGLLADLESRTTEMGNNTRKKIEERLLPKYENRFKIMLVPNITNICYGRGVGYKIEEVVLSQNIQKISATKIRAKMRKEGKLKN